jgi:hypothetical protein
MQYEPEWSCGTSFLVEPTSSAPSLEFQVYDSTVTRKARFVEGEIGAIVRQKCYKSASLLNGNSSVGSNGID